MSGDSIPCLYSVSAILFPLNLIRLLLSLFRIVLEGFTKTEICQGHRSHFAICCKIKLGEVVYFSLFGLLLPSTIFLLTSGLTCCERDGGREDREGEMTWMATRVGMSFCSLCGSGSEISWHLIVPFFYYNYFYSIIGALANALKNPTSVCTTPNSFCSQYEPLDSKYSSRIECRGSVRYSGLFLCHLREAPSQIKASGCCSLQLNAFATYPAHQSDRDREGEKGREQE